MSLGIQTGLMSNHGLVFKSTDSDVNNLLAAVATNGGSVSYTQASYVDILVKAIKNINSNAVWSSAKGIYLFIGGNAGSNVLNAKNLAANATVVGMMNHNPVMGIMGSMQSGWFDTGFAPATTFADNLTGMAYYCNRGAKFSNGQFDISASNYSTNFNNPVSFMQLTSWQVPSVQAGGYASYVNFANTGDNFTTIDSQRGFLGYTQTATAQGYLYKDTTLERSNVASGSTATIPTQTLVLGGDHYFIASGSLTGVTSNCARGWGFLYIGTTIAQADLQSLQGVVATYISSMGRDGSTLPAGFKNIVCIGDSLTQGFEASGPAAAYPSILKNTFSSNNAIVNAGIPGIGVVDGSGGFASGANTRADWANLFLSQASKNICVFWLGTNDLGSAVTAASTYSGLSTAISAAKTAGYKVAILTCIDRRDQGAGQTTYNAQRVLLNASINSNSAGADIVIDVASLIQFTNATNLTYYQGDTVHLTDLGYSIIGSSVASGIATL